MGNVTRADVQAGLQEIFRNVFNDDSIVISDTTTAQNISGWDSLQQIKIILACEKKFAIRLRARDINALENAGEMIDHLMSAITKSLQK